MGRPTYVAPTLYTEGDITLWVWEWQAYHHCPLGTKYFNFAAVVGTTETSGTPVYEVRERSTLSVCAPDLKRILPLVVAAVQHALTTAPIFAEVYEHLAEARILQNPLTKPKRRATVGPQKEARR